MTRGAVSVDRRQVSRFIVFGVPAARYGVCCGVVTHDEVRPRLAAYAAGALDAVAAEEIRAHLASGCESCLHELFGRPVGLPRAIPEPPASTPLTVPAPIAPAAAPRARGLFVGVV